MELTWNERAVLHTLYTGKALPGSNKGGKYGWNMAEVISHLGRLGLIVWREIPHQDGEMIAQLTELGVRAYEKGVRLGVQPVVEDPML
jgi:hypothetical protein